MSDDRSRRPVGAIAQLLSSVGPAAALSVVLHASVWGWLGVLPPLRDLLASVRDVHVELVAEPPPEPPEPEVVEPEPEPEVVEPEPPPEIPPPEPVRERIREPETTPDPTPAEEVPPEEPPPMEERIEDFTGETLSNPDPSAPTIIGGNGEAITGPVGAATGTTTGRSRRGAPDGAPSGTGSDPEADGVPIVDADDLSRQTTSPDRLRSLVSDRYPPELRARGVEGEARVRFVVTPSGRLLRLALVSESAPGFGNACIDALRETSGEWAAPLDRAGREVAQRVSFRCTFSLRF